MESTRLTRISIKASDPYHDLIVQGYNSHDSKQAYIRDSLLVMSILTDKLPTLKFFLDKQVASNKVESIDEDIFFQWISIMRKADALIENKVDNEIPTLQSQLAPVTATVATPVTATVATPVTATVATPVTATEATPVTEVIAEPIVKTKVKVNFTNLVADANR